MSEDKTWYSLFYVTDDWQPFHRLADIDETGTYLIPFPQDKEADFYVGEKALDFYGSTPNLVENTQS